MHLATGFAFLRFRLAALSRGLAHLLLLLFGLVSISLLWAAPALAQMSKGRVDGQVVDKTGGVLQGAEVVLQPGGASGKSDSQGNFSIADVAPGSYTLTVSYVGFAPFTSKVTVTAGGVARVTAALAVASSTQQVTVVATPLHGEAEAVNIQRTADNILNVIPADVITSLPNATIADAAGRLPGVSLERDEGEGKYIDVRGTAPELTNTTIDGINTPSPEGGVRQVKLDTIPADLVASVEVNKTLQANQDADGIGGSVNLVTKTAGEKPSLSFGGIGGYTPIVDGRHMDQFNFTVGDRFGASKRLGMLFGASYDYNGRGIDDIEPVPDAVQNPNGSLTPTFDSMDIREYAYNRSRWGFGGSTDYRIKESSVISLRYLYSAFKDYGDKWVYTLNDGSAPGFSNEARRPKYSIGNLALTGTHTKNSYLIHWEASVADASQLASAGNPGADFGPIGALANSTGCLYDAPATSNIYLPQWTPSCFTPGPDDLYQPSMYSLSDVVYSHGLTEQLNLQGSADVSKYYYLGSHFATFQFGGKVRNAHKFDDSWQDTFTPNGTLLMAQFLSNFTNPNYYDRHYTLGPVTNWNDITGFVNSNPSQFGFSSTFGGNNNNFDLIERISAGYAMNTVDLGRVRLITGLRFEETQVHTLSCNCTNQITGTGPVNVPFNGSYYDVLPSAAARIRLDDNSDLRLVYSRGLARPDPEYLTTAVTEDTTTHPFTFSIGNPGLKPEHANNFDVLYERYLKPFGMISGGVFYKSLTDPIIETESHPVTGPYAGYILQQPGNAGSAFVAGFEAAYQQNFNSLPGVWSGLGIMANYLYAASRAYDLQGRSDHPPLLRTSPSVWNISPSYARGRVTMRFGATYNGASIYQYNYQDGAAYGINGPNGDNYLYPHFQIDAQASVRVRGGLSLLASGLNLSNEVFGFYNGGIQYMTQREYYKPTYEVGFRWVSGSEK
ncbi:MAG TPA: TonB-dependent receptor [Terriglobia bacterium]